jgi:hypothetical protein|nr:MAG TPA: hypothetical protein [Caudoviricetes sp.]
MKFKGLAIEEKYIQENDEWSWKMIGTITFESGKKDIITLKIEEKDVKKFIADALPLFDRCLNEKIEHIKKEVGIESEARNG